MAEVETIIEHQVVCEKCQWKSIKTPNRRDATKWAKAHDLMHAVGLA